MYVHMDLSICQPNNVHLSTYFSAISSISEVNCNYYQWIMFNKPYEDTYNLWFILKLFSIML